MNQTITLISDWRLRDPYVAMFKGELLAAMPEINILDITHHVDLSNIAQTAFLMRQSYDRFPKGSIHLLLTNVSGNSTFAPVLLEHDGHCFIGEDNGIFTLMFGEEELVGRQFSKIENLTVFEKIIQLSKAVADGNVLKITKEYDHFEHKITEQAFHIPPMKTIEGEIIYVDAYCNAITNIPVKMFKEAVQNHPFTAIVQSKNDWKIQLYHSDYCSEKEMYLTDSSLNCMEITMTNGRVAALADLRVGDKVTITYE